MQRRDRRDFARAIAREHREGSALRSLRTLRSSGSDLRDDQRNSQRRFVREESVRFFAVIAERFAVIGGNGNERLRIDGIDERTSGAIDRRDLAVIRRRSPS